MASGCDLGGLGETGGTDAAGTAASSAAGSETSGSRTVKMMPQPGALATAIVPSMTSSRRAVIARPRSVPQKPGRRGIALGEGPEQAGALGLIHADHPLKGVRISWLMAARNSDLARFARAASSRFVTSSAVRRSTSVAAMATADDHRGDDGDHDGHPSRLEHDPRGPHAAGSSQRFL
jgi:hypothetical protein